MKKQWEEPEVVFLDIEETEEIENPPGSDTSWGDQ